MQEKIIFLSCLNILVDFCIQMKYVISLLGLLIGSFPFVYKQFGQSRRKKRYQQKIELCLFYWFWCFVETFMRELSPKVKKILLVYLIYLIYLFLVINSDIFSKVTLWKVCPDSSRICQEGLEVSKLSQNNVMTILTTSVRSWIWIKRNNAHNLKSSRWVCVSWIAKITL